MSAEISDFAKRGPHGYPLRFAVRKAGLRGLKIFGDDYKQPIHYVRKHDNRDGHNRIVLHSVAHKADYDSENTAMVSIHKRQSLGRRMAAALTDLDNMIENKHFEVAVRGQRGQLQSIQMQYVRPQLRNVYNSVKSGTSMAEIVGSVQPAFRFALGREQFEWRRALSTCAEVRAIRKRGSPPVRAGDPRPPAKAITTIAKGWVLVRVTGRRGNANALGFTDRGEEIVASFARDRWGFRSKIYFHWWNSGATGELGRDFAHVAAATGTAIWHDEILEEKKKQRART
ncbi:hypothetical protein VTK26DRAFT_4697 [Humicola hyalothermophila]